MSGRDKGVKTAKMTPAKAKRLITLFERGQKHYNANRFADAVAVARQGLALYPGEPHFAYLLARALVDTGRYQEALEYADIAEAATPNGYEQLLAKGRALLFLGRHEEAVDYFARCRLIDPSRWEAWLAPTKSLIALERLDEAEQTTLMALHLRESAICHAAYGLVLASMGRPEQSLVHFSKAIELDPHYVDGNYNAYFAAVESGHLAEASQLLELGFQNGTRSPNRRFPHMSRWQGEDVSQSRLLIWREQGIGDELWHCVAYRWAVEQAKECTIETNARLVPLFQSSFPKATVIAEQPFNTDKHRDDADFHTPGAALFALLGDNGRANEFLRQQRAWLKAGPEKAALWRDRVSALGSNLKVGIAWRSGFINVARSASYFSLTDAKPIFDNPGITFVNLQYGDVSEELAEAREKLGVTLEVWDDLNLKDDFEGVVALMANLDIVITPTTAVHRLAVAAGVETWLVSPGASQVLQPPARFPFDPDYVFHWRRHWTETWPSLLNRVSVDLADRARAHFG